MEITNSLTFNLVGILVALLAVVITYFKWTYTYWARKGVETPKTSIPFGNVAALFYKTSSLGELWRDMYNEAKEKKLPYIGSYFLTRKQFMAVDLDLIKSIVQTDFKHFVNHGFYCNEEGDPLTGNLFSLEDLKWKNLRAKLTPTFTSGKMKMMFESLASCAEDLKYVMGELSSGDKPVEIKDVLACFSTDIIGSCAFGIKPKSLKNPDVEFRNNGRLFFENSPTMDTFRTLAQFAVPTKYLQMLKVKVFHPKITKFFLNMVKDTVEYREKNNVHRKDFMHLMIQLKNRGKISDDGKITDETGQTHELSLNIKEIAAQSFVFFLGGFETSATAMAFALFEISQNSEIQNKMREEIKTVMEKYDNKLTYEGIMEMPYLEKVVNETLRKYPPGPALPRICNKDYIVPGTNLKIEAGTLIKVSVLGIHNDPEYYPEPEKFDPERFTEENIASRPPFSYLPFGAGPRVCIGQRFGLMQIKVGLVTILNNFEISLNEKTQTPLEFGKTGLTLHAKNGIWMNMKKIKN